MVRGWRGEQRREFAVGNETERTGWRGKNKDVGEVN